MTWVYSSRRALSAFPASKNAGGSRFPGFLALPGGRACLPCDSAALVAAASDYLEEYTDGTTLEYRKSEREAINNMKAERYLPLFCARVDEAADDTAMSDKVAEASAEKKMKLGHYVLDKMQDLYSAHRSGYGEYDAYLSAICTVAARSEESSLFVRSREPEAIPHDSCTTTTSTSRYRLQPNPSHAGGFNWRDALFSFLFVAASRRRQGQNPFDISF